MQRQRLALTAENRMVLSLYSSSQKVRSFIAFIACLFLSSLPMIAADEISIENTPRLNCIRQFHKLEIPEKLSMDLMNADEMIVLLIAVRFFV